LFATPEGLDDRRTRPTGRDRVRHRLDPATAARLDTQLEVVRGAALAADLPAVARATPALLAAVQAARAG
jgi:hypothetical protein